MSGLPSVVARNAVQPLPFGAGNLAARVPRPRIYGNLGCIGKLYIVNGLRLYSDLSPIFLYFVRVVQVVRVSHFEH